MGSENKHLKIKIHNLYLKILNANYNENLLSKVFINLL